MEPKLSLAIIPEQTFDLLEVTCLPLSMQYRDEAAGALKLVTPQPIY